MRRSMYRPALAIAVAVMLLGGSVAVAAQGLDGANTYTGCLSRGGGLNKVAIGDQPAKPCTDDQQQISWSEGVSPSEFAALADRVAELEARTDPLNVQVDCDAGESVQQAIDQANPGQPLRVTIEGTCTEDVYIAHDRVTLEGSGPGAGIQAPPGGTAVAVDSARLVGILGLTLSADENSTPFEARRGAAVLALNVDVAGGAWGVLALSNASLTIEGGTVSDSRLDGVRAEGGAHVAIDGGTVVTGAGGGGISAEDGGSVDVVDATVEDNDSFGVSAWDGGSILLESDDTIVRNNRQGGVHLSAGIVRIADGAVVTGNEDSGIVVRGGDLSVRDGAVVEENAGNGIDVIGASTVKLENAAVRRNSGDGVFFWDTGVIWNGSPATIADNGGWGIHCEGVARINKASTFVFSGNAAGDTNCPVG